MWKGRIFFSVLLVALLAGSAPAAAPAAHFDGSSWWERLKVIASDKMAGRDTGTPGERAAQQYVIDQLEKAGVQPAGVNGFFQPVKFVSHRIVEEKSSLALVSGDTREPLTLGQEAIISSRTVPAPHIKAGLVFAGYGLRIPEASYDDFAGLDCAGKLVVIISGSPAGVSGAIASHYQTRAERWKTLKSVGAIGLIGIENPALVEVPWARMVLNRNQPSMDLDYPEFNETSGEQLAVVVNPESAPKLFAGSGHQFQEIVELAKQNQPLPHFPLAQSLEATTALETHTLQSANVVGKLTGSDPSDKSEYVVLSAHLDHLGVAQPVNGDRIYNGAMDNGSGCALLLDLAASLQHEKTNLRRSVLFLFVTGEEKGLLGSKYFAAHPTVPLNSMVADLNVDMFLPIIPLKVLTVYGLAESDLGDQVKDAAAPLGVPVQPDPQPQHNIFIRSDQYNFIRHGIPALMIDVGAYPGSDDAKVLTQWRHERYHAPSDDTNQPVNLDTAAKYEEVIRALLVEVADNPHRPEWKPNSFFRRYAQQQVSAGK